MNIEMISQLSLQALRTKTGQDWFVAEHEVEGQKSFSISSGRLQFVYRPATNDWLGEIVGQADVGSVTGHTIAIVHENMAAKISAHIMKTNAVWAGVDPEEAVL